MGNIKKKCEKCMQKIRTDLKCRGVVCDRDLTVNLTVSTAKMTYNHNKIKNTSNSLLSVGCDCVTAAQW